MIERRTFLQWGTVAPLLMTGPVGADTSIAPLQNTIVVIDGIHPDTDPEKLAVVLSVFAREDLPVTCVVDFRNGGRRALQAESALCKVLREQVMALPGLIKIVPFVRDLGAMTPHFQARAAYEAQVDLHRGLWGEEVLNFAVNGQTIACDLLSQTTAPSGVRASGIRNVLMPASITMPAQPEAWNDGVVRMKGGQRVQLKTPRRALKTSGRNAVEKILYLSATDFAAESAVALGNYASTFASHVLHEEGNNWVNSILASDIQYRDAYAFRRNLGVHFTISEDASFDDQAILANFRLELIRAGMPSSFGPETNVGTKSAYWIAVEGKRLADLPTRPVEVFDKIDGEFRPAETLTSGTPYGTGVRLVEANDPGIDADNILRLASVAVRDTDSLSKLSPAVVGNGDRVIVVSGKILSNSPLRRALKQRLIEISQDGISEFVTLPDYVRRIVPKGPYLTHFRRTQTFQQMATPAVKAPEQDQHELLMEDARVAWAYFERWTNRSTGLCPATMSFSGAARESHEAVTMWDVGSHINALMAAVDLKFISPERFRRSIRSILPHIAGRHSQGRLLPQGWIATDKFKWGNRDFDGCDAGRLLAALYNLDTHPLTKDKSASTVKRWDLAKIVDNGVIFSVEKGKLVSTFTSHCAHYAAWAFRTWGIEARSPYEVFRGNSTSDDKMRLLEVCGKIGPMGAEPLLMEALELGMSPESAYLADTLFAAQLEEFEETGRLMCVSEGPIDGPPWFLYQGLQFDASGRIWAIDTVEGLDEHRTEAFRNDNLAISTKGAYLWAAYKEHPFCNALVEEVRAKAKTSNGFASNINLRTGEPSSSYSDINTNAVILQSVAHIIKTNAADKASLR